MPESLLTRATADDLPILLELVQEFCALDRHAYDRDRVAVALVLWLVLRGCRSQIGAQLRLDGVATPCQVSRNYECRNGGYPAFSLPRCICVTATVCRCY